MSTDAILKSLDQVEEKINTRNIEFSDRLLQLEQKGAMHNSGAANHSNPEELGSKVVKAFDENRELFEKTKSVRLEVAIKAAGDPVTTSNGRSIISGGVGSPNGNVLGFQNALSTRNAPNTSAVEYSRFTGQQGAAAVQAAEGDTKAAVRPDHTLITQSAITIAGFTKMSRQALSDSNELARAVQTTLLRGVNTSLDVALVNGVIAPAFDGFETLATAYTSLIYSELVDAISEGVAALQLAGFSPDIVALNPSDWLDINTAKGVSNDHYLSGSYLGALPTDLRGLRVVLSPSINAGKALILDSTHSELLMANNLTVEVAYSGDDFTRNLTTLLAEMRVLPIFRTVGSARLITPKAA